MAQTNRKKRLEEAAEQAEVEAQLPKPGDPDWVDPEWRDLSAFIGDDADEFKQVWREMCRRERELGDKKGGGVVVFDFNFPVFFTSFFWLAYRKMYFIAFLAWLFIATLPVATLFLFTVPTEVLIALPFAGAAVVATIARSVYIDHCRRKIATLETLGRLRDLSAEDRAARLAEAGGVNPKAVIALVVGFIFAFLFLPSN